MESQVQSLLSNVTHSLNNMAIQKTSKPKTLLFQVGEKVEIRSSEIGLEGSWNRATIVSVNRRFCHVKYDNLIILDEFPEKIAEVVIFSPEVPKRLRPLPPEGSFESPDLCFGSCVDVYVNQAWWEGVVIDHENGCNQRKVLFPDSGRELMMTVENVRISLDWDPLNGVWRHRGRWALLLELIEDFRIYVTCDIDAVANQCWRRVKEKLTDWNSVAQQLWMELVPEIRKELDNNKNNNKPSSPCKVLESEPLHSLFNHQEMMITNAVPVESEVSNECSDNDEELYRWRKSGHEASANWFPVGPDLLPEPKFCPESITKFARWVTKRRPESLTLEVRQHLAHEGWRIEAMGYRNSYRYKYTFPDHSKSYLSLCQLCHELDCSPISHNDPPTESPNIEQLQWKRLFPGTKFCPGAITEFVLLGTKKPPKSLLLDVRQHLSYMGWKIETLEYLSSLRYKYTSPDNCKIYVSLRQLCHDLNSSSIAGDDLPTELDKESLSRAQPKRKKLSPEVESSSKRIKVCLTPETAGDDHPTTVPEPGKRPRIDPPSCSKHKRQKILSLLIDDNAELLGAKVQYRGSKVTGKITGDGIECDCCQQVFTLIGFEVHAGVTNHRPAANIVLEDGRSLSDLQKKMVGKKAPKRKAARRKQHRIEDEYLCHDLICTLCQDGGKLILCETCPSAYHTSCLHLEDVPRGNWFCPSCRCHICGQRQLKKDASILTCSQCLQKNHVRCLEVERKGSNFCSNKCEDLYLGIEKILEKPIVVGEDNLTWTLLKPLEFDNCDSELLVENHSKLNLVLDVMHECFEPMKDFFTGRDISKDIAFGQESSLPRLNFRGFCSILLERNEEVIAAATLRICNHKVAELPLVATRFRYRRQGMCSILMDELEKQLMKLGVEKIVLPAAPFVLNTWKNAFGFSEMTGSDRLQYLDVCNFVYFFGTSMCHKVLTR